MQMLGVSSEKEFANMIGDYEQVGACIEDTRLSLQDGSIPEIITKFSSNNNKAFMSPDYMTNYTKHYP